MNHSIQRSNSSDLLWEPFRALGDIDDLFSSRVMPALDVAEDENEFVLHADLPGIRKEDVELTITDNTLVLKGERKTVSEKKEKGWSRTERWAGSFRRVLEFASAIDSSKAKASFKDGVLEIRVPKAEAAKPKQIKVDVN